MSRAVTSAAAVPDARTPAAARDATEADVAAVQAIYAHHVLNGTATFEEVAPDVTEMLRRRGEIVARRLPYLVAGVGETVQGFAYAAPYRPRSAYRFTVEDSIYVDPEATGRGLGRLLLGALVERATALGYRQMVAVIGDSGNTASIRLHAGLGFVHAGTLTATGFKFGRWVDTVTMQRSLGPGADTLP